MVPRDRILDIARKLEQKSKNDQVQWIDVGQDEYVVEFPGSRFSITYRSPETEPDFIHMGIYNQEGRHVGGLSLDEEDPEWDVALSLFHEAERCVTGWDKVVEEIEKEVAKEGGIGSQRSGTVVTARGKAGSSLGTVRPAQQRETEEEDIPF